ncbi:MAG: hypothetical protein ACTTH7_01340 [Treponema sp.]
MGTGDVIVGGNTDGNTADNTDGMLPAWIAPFPIYKIFFNVSVNFINRVFISTFLLYTDKKIIAGLSVRTLCD